MCYNRGMNKTREQIAENITRFAGKNGFHIHPGQDPNTWADLVLLKGGCPCVPGRNSCPCASAVEDIKTLGRCRCGLFVTDDYLVTYNNLKSEANAKRKNSSTNHTLNNIPELNGKAREAFLKKICINGFSIEENGTRITLRPRGLEAEAELTIEDDPGNGYRVVDAAGKFSGYTRGQKRKFFEDNLNRWVLESVQQAP